MDFGSGLCMGMGTATAMSNHYNGDEQKKIKEKDYIISLQSQIIELQNQLIQKDQQIKNLMTMLQEERERNK